MAERAIQNYEEFGSLSTTEEEEFSQTGGEGNKVMGEMPVEKVYGYTAAAAAAGIAGHGMMKKGGLEVEDEETKKRFHSASSLKRMFWEDKSEAMARAASMARAVREQQELSEQEERARADKANTQERGVVAVGGDGRRCFSLAAGHAPAVFSTVSTLNMQEKKEVALGAAESPPPSSSSSSSSRSSAVVGQERSGGDSGVGRRGGRDMCASRTTVAVAVTAEAVLERPQPPATPATVAVTPAVVEKEAAASGWLLGSGGGGDVPCRPYHEAPVFNPESPNHHHHPSDDDDPTALAWHLHSLPRECLLRVADYF
jgi:hypothetical protein